MVWTNVGKSGNSMLMGPSGGTYPSFMELDGGSQGVSVSTSGVSSAYAEKSISSYDQSINNEILLTTNWNSVELSGTTCYGFGVKESTGDSGADWAVVNFAATGSINFDGTKELQLQIRLKNK